MAMSPGTAVQGKELAAALEGTLASLAENLAVLQILDKAAEGWPGVAVCMEAMDATTRAAASLLIGVADREARVDRRVGSTMREAQQLRKQVGDLTMECERSRRVSNGADSDLRKLRDQVSSSQKELARVKVNQQAKVCSASTLCYHSALGDYHDSPSLKRSRGFLTTSCVHYTFCVCSSRSATAECESTYWGDMAATLAACARRWTVSSTNARSCKGN